MKQRDFIGDRIYERPSVFVLREYGDHDLLISNKKQAAFLVLLPIYRCRKSDKIKSESENDFIYFIL